MLTTYQNFVLIYGTVVKLLPCYFFIHSLFWNKSVTVLLHLVLETWDHKNVKIWPFYLMIVFIPLYKLFFIAELCFVKKVFTMCLIFMNTLFTPLSSELWQLLSIFIILKEKRSHFKITFLNHHQKYQESEYYTMVLFILYVSLWF